MEVCIDSVQSAINSETGGACRVELCASLADGGTTPSLGMLKVIKQNISIPVFCMIRPRGGDFCYNDLELEVMKADILCLKQAGADGFVFGILTQDGDVDMVKCKQLLDLIRPLPATFHRAIDMSRDILQSLAAVKKLGFERVLSSGGKPTALQGVNTLKEMVKLVRNKKVLILCGGIQIDNLETILHSTGAQEFHGSARETLNSSMIFQKPDISMGSQPGCEFISKVTSVSVVKTLISLANLIWNR
ncbi:unnamed protein product [Candidula unifasciata]|uniref:Copper homeostasis protein cutC homolog n=1 Tax=Candidula unifasciata TaxID=100452 RepID=A0A8S3YR36_9EUPU|nr:unnamed protein product [Candidula unifasciata]